MKIPDLHQIYPFQNNYDIRENGIKIISKADKSYIFDNVGNKILDALSGLWCVNIGYGRKELAEAARFQMTELPYCNNFFKTTNSPSEKLSEELVKISAGNLNNVFFGTSGSDANDSIVQFIRQYWNILDKKEKKVIISLDNAYHGSTLVAASLGGMKPMHSASSLPLPGFVHIMPPYYYKFGSGQTQEDFGIFSANELENKILEIGPENVAAFFIEPIQGGGGAIIPPDNYLPLIKNICKKYDVLLCVDEVITGFGRTGNWFASSAYNLEPDFITLAKGLTSGYAPLSAVMVGDRIAKVLLDKEIKLQHGYTFTGHPVSCAVALENIRILREENLIESSREVSKILENSLNYIKDKSNLIGDIRIKGMIGAIQIRKEILLEDKKISYRYSKLLDFFISNGLIVDVMENGILFAPSLCWKESEVHEFTQKIISGLDFLTRN
ncbi:aminotransferase [Mycoavidus sp. SF9855]|uniref:aminotransferase n=1 Tax=Mycoavidus sp. SF9855 TaxID=2968475 RepID=UPI00211C77C1|nr:aminotransferase [Mycoavidus sp. SF9855]UUM22062.1 aminotransferase [Mycoavidus sp. SF9855]